MRMNTTSYNFKITTSERIMFVFGTVMSRSDEGTLIDLWCPEEPCLTKKITVEQEDIGDALNALLREHLEGLYATETPFSIEYLQ